jgi:hypothetical protein
MSPTLRLMFATLCLLAAGLRRSFRWFRFESIGMVSVRDAVSVVQLGFVRDVKGKQLKGDRRYIEPRDRHHYQLLRRSKQKFSHEIRLCARAEFSPAVLCAALAVVVVATE